MQRPKARMLTIPQESMAGSQGIEISHAFCVGWRTLFSVLSLAHFGSLQAHVCRTGQMVLSSVLCCPMRQHKQQFKKMQKLTFQWILSYLLLKSMFYFIKQNDQVACPHAGH